MSRTPSTGRRTALLAALEKIIEFFIRACGWSSIFLVIAIFCFVFWYAAPLLPKIDWFGQDGFFTSSNWHAKDREGATYGILASSFGFMCLFFGNAFNLAEVINKGRLDYYLSLPRPVLLHTVASRMIASGMGDFSYGFISFAFS